MGPLLAADRAVRARRHHGPAREGEPWLDPLLRVETWSALRRHQGHRQSVARSRSGELHAIIGPNGAGKTTLISQLTGQLMPNSGAIHFAGRDVTWLPSYQRSRLGWRARSRSPACCRISPRRQCRARGAGHDGHSFRFWGAARKEKHLRDAAQAALTRVGLAKRADVPVSELSHGEQRELELAVALATKPQLLLLDEPMAASASPNPRAWWRC
jgi:branched-chain amino acid transport system ATP-binding protein